MMEVIMPLRTITLSIDTDTGVCWMSGCALESADGWNASSTRWSYVTKLLNIFCKCTKKYQLLLSQKYDIIFTFRLSSQRGECSCGQQGHQDNEQITFHFDLVVVVADCFTMSLQFLWHCIYTRLLAVSEFRQ